MFKDFRSFIAKGNVIDLATGVIIGAAFGKIVSSLVADVIMPPVGLLLGQVDFASLFINLSSTPYETLEEAKKAGAPTINYGIFLNNVLDFIIVGLCVYILVRQLARFQKPQTAAASDPSCMYCCMTVNPLATRCPHCTSQLQGRAIGL